MHPCAAGCASRTYTNRKCASSLNFSRTASTSSNRNRNGSHVSGELQAGVWAAAVTAAFGGESPKAREADGRLTVRIEHDGRDDSQLGLELLDDRVQALAGALRTDRTPSGAILVAEVPCA